MEAHHSILSRMVVTSSLFTDVTKRKMRFYGGRRESSQEPSSRDEMHSMDGQLKTLPSDFLDN